MHTTIIFDLDGTLLDTLDDLTNSVNYTLVKYHLPKKTRDEIRSYLGNGMERLIELSVPNGKQTENFYQILQDFKAYYLVNANVKTCAYGGIMELLKVLKEKGYNLAIVSNKGYQSVNFLREYYFKDLIELAIGEKEGIRKKPYPDTVNEVLTSFNEIKEHAYYVGDSEVDIETARRAEMKCLSVSWGFRTKQQLIDFGASLIFDTPQALLDYIINND